MSRTISGFFQTASCGFDRLLVATMASDQQGATISWTLKVWLASSSAGMQPTKAFDTNTVVATIYIVVAW
jgi:hypothetical protein